MIFEHWYLEYWGYVVVICKSQPLLFFKYYTLDISNISKFLKQSKLVQNNKVWPYIPHLYHVNLDFIV